MAITTDFSELFFATGIVEQTSSGYKFTITADAGYVFDSYLNYSRSMGYGMFDDNCYTTDEDLSSDRTTIIFETSSAVRWVKGSAVQATKEISTFTNLYHVTENILSELSKVRFVNLSTNELYDYGTYIYKVYTVPFDITALDTSTKSEIMFGSFNTKVSAPKLTDYLFNVDLGSIPIVPKYHSKLDYNNTTIYLYLPFVPRTALDVNEVMGTTLEIVLQCNMYEGTGNYLIKTNGTVILTVPVTYSDTIPIMQKNTYDMGGIIGNIAVHSMNEVTQPFIKIVREIPVEVITNANNAEREMIKQLINDGIINR